MAEFWAEWSILAYAGAAGWYPAPRLDANGVGWMIGLAFVLALISKFIRSHAPVPAAPR